MSEMGLVVLTLVALIGIPTFIFVRERRAGLRIDEALRVEHRRFMYQVRKGLGLPPEDSEAATVDEIYRAEFNEEPVDYASRALVERAVGKAAVARAEGGAE